MNEIYKVEFVNRSIVEVWWFQILGIIFAATLASCLTYFFTRKISKRTEINRLINNIYIDLRVYGEAYLNFIEYDNRVKKATKKHKDIRDKDAALLAAENIRNDLDISVEYKKRYEGTRASLIANTRLLNSLLSSKLKSKKTDYGKYVSNILTIPATSNEDTNRKDLNKLQKELEKHVHKLENLLTTVHYENNNSWLRNGIDRYLFIIKSGAKEYRKQSGKRYDD